MKRIVFAIPSYHRPDRQPLIRWLNRLGIGRDDIVLTVQNDEDRTAYQKWGSMCRIEGSKNGVGVSFNRNQCLRVEPGARLLMCDDGIRSINVRGADGRCEVIRTKERLLSMLDRMFSFCEARGVSVFSLNNSSSGLCASGFDFINHPFVSICMGVIDRRVQFDPKVRFLEDVERNLRILRGGGRTYRFAYAFPNVQHGEEGGQCAMHRDPRVDVFYKRLLARDHAGRVSVSERNGTCRLNVIRGTYRKVKGVLYGKI